MRADLVSLGVRLGWVAADEKEEPALVKVRERLATRGRGFCSPMTTRSTRSRSICRPSQPQLSFLEIGLGAELLGAYRL